MDFLRRLIGLPDKSHPQLPEESKERNIFEKSPVPPFLSEKFPWMENAFRIEKNDCASCKYIGSGLCYSVAIYILSTLRSPPKEAIKRKVPFYFTVASITSTFFILGTCRLFDLGVSAPQDPDEVKVFQDFLNDDIEALKKYINNTSGKEIFKPSRRSILAQMEKLQKEKNETDH